ncbi:hypothetical protein BDB01DRAFT_379635 [Pilobolus umbonatus]|nr:hypothetical protein BDB01DRAFT_379635 [Pilobolus umbonatus]
MTITDNTTVNDRTITNNTTVNDVTITNNTTVNDMTITNNTTVNDRTITNNTTVNDMTIENDTTVNDITIVNDMTTIMREMDITDTTEDDLVVDNGTPDYIPMDSITLDDIKVKDTTSNNTTRVIDSIRDTISVHDKPTLNDSRAHTSRTPERGDDPLQSLVASAVDQYKSSHEQDTEERIMKDLSVITDIESVIRHLPVYNNDGHPPEVLNDQSVKDTDLLRTEEDTWTSKNDLIELVKRIMALKPDNELEDEQPVIEVIDDTMIQQVQNMMYLKNQLQYLIDACAAHESTLVVQLYIFPVPIMLDFMELEGQLQQYGKVLNYISRKVKDHTKYFTVQMEVTKTKYDSIPPLMEVADHSLPIFKTKNEE